MWASATQALHSAPWKAKQLVNNKTKSKTTKKLRRRNKDRGWTPLPPYQATAPRPCNKQCPPPSPWYCSSDVILMMLENMIWTMLHIDDAAHAAHGGDHIDRDHHHRHHRMSKPIEKSQAVAQSPSSWLWVNSWNDCTVLAADFCCSLPVMIVIMIAPTKSLVCFTW